MSAPGKLAGRLFWILAWVAALGLATLFLGRWEQARHNPNASPESIRGEGYSEVRLLGNPQGHYLLDGRIDGQRVTLMLDTGATDMAIPGELAARLGLASGAEVEISTANGSAAAYRTRVRQLQLGAIRLDDVTALIVPGMDGDEVLLGMSALKQLEFTQRDGTLVLRQTP
ncbi:MAG: TIGR02281 family clan AA aspartic protease [Pseudomonas sp.]|uniref:retropepsin-like aspartic protease family protein n=1 Tax=Pseudomonas sp. TaxID=306 RepID=UPI003397E65A